ncbi:Mitochondrial translocator assembly and maintenance protein 41 -like protein [Trichinella britovi]|uniref:Phosphatidate cytidylyltransferase, mitochondrial n=1 Tax=Trichinella britovi TaxID=45882 RepID=A0A0V1DD98_TRIBR|nr:Mitochondrial translocator assembly and maintenance protein 41 -like protein [Trichinella britovi]
MDGTSSSFIIDLDNREEDEVHMRYLCMEDVSEVKKLYSDVFPLEYPDHWFEHVSRSQSLWSMAAVCGQSIVGILVAEVRMLMDCHPEDHGILAKSFSLDTPVCYILSLGVRKSWRRKNIASKLLSHLLSYLRNIMSPSGPVRCVFLHVLVSNVGAIKFYEHWDFRRHCRLKDYYYINGEYQDSFTYTFYMNGGLPNWSLKNLFASMVSSLTIPCASFFRRIFGGNLLAFIRCDSFHPDVVLVFFAYFAKITCKRFLKQSLNCGQFGIEKLMQQTRRDYSNNYYLAMMMHLERIASIFPRTSVSMMFAYGSGVIAQRNSEIKRNMIDFVVVVDKPLEWHKENLKLNSSHYSMLRYIGAERLTKLQTDYAARVYCNTMVRVGEFSIKYSVIRTSHLISDLIDWKSLYISGRMHKPVRVLIPPTSRELEEACKMNLKNACHMALLILPEKFNEEQLYTTIASLSYSGDIRMKIAEDRNKVANIVQQNMRQFAHMYEPILNHLCEEIPLTRSGQYFNHLLTTDNILHLLELLPSQVLFEIENYMQKCNPQQCDLEEIIFSLANDINYAEKLKYAVERIVFKSSYQQTMKNFLTAGFLKSSRYFGKKLQKMFTNYMKSAELIKDKDRCARKASDKGFLHGLKLALTCGIEIGFPEGYAHTLTQIIDNDVSAKEWHQKLSTCKRILTICQKFQLSSKSNLLPHLKQLRVQQKRLQLPDQYQSISTENELLF